MIENGYGTGFFASGVLIESCSPYFEYCTIANNIANGTYSSGGGVTITGFDATAAPIFSNCIFKGNQCSVIGGAVHSNNTSNRPRFVGCLFDGNTADRGAAIHNGGGVVIVINCTIVNNTAEKGSATYTT
ncbi:MAG: hypothetical protein HYZ16_11005 [Bacteroidetes bacterium]|nr:hypothetical protein [Bacteroidota bacterium]